MVEGEESPDPWGECPWFGSACALHAAAARTVSQLSKARTRQLRWVITELHTATTLLPTTDTGTDTDPGAGTGADLGAGPGAAGVGATRLPAVVHGDVAAAAAEHRSAAGVCTFWLTTRAAHAYLNLAEHGLLRTRTRRGRPTTSTGAEQPTPQAPPPPVAQRPSSFHAHRVRAGCLHLLAAAAHVPAPAISALPGRLPEFSEAPDTRQLLAHLDAGAHDAQAIRTWLCAQLASEGLRVAEIAALVLGNVTYDHHLVNITRNAPGPGAPTLLEHLEPTAGTRRALREWLELRTALAASERVTALLVTTHPAIRPGGAIYAAGLPVSARALTRCHQRACAAWLDQTNPTRERTHARSAFSLGQLADRAPTP